MKYIIILILIFFVLTGCKKSEISTVPSNQNISDEQEDSKTNQAVEYAQNIIESGKYIKGVLLISFSQETTKEEAESILAKYNLKINKITIPPPEDSELTSDKGIGGTEIEEWHDDIKGAVVKVPEGQEMEYMKKLMKEPMIEFVELSPIFEAF